MRDELGEGREAAADAAPEEGDGALEDGVDVGRRDGEVGGLDAEARVAVDEGRRRGGEGEEDRRGEGVALGEEGPCEAVEEDEAVGAHRVDGVGNGAGQHGVDLVPLGVLLAVGPHRPEAREAQERVERRDERRRLDADAVLDEWVKSSEVDASVGTRRLPVRPPLLEDPSDDARLPLAPLCERGTRTVSMST